MNNLNLKNCRSALRLAFFFTSIAVIYFASLPLALAVTPAPDGGYPGFNTAEGTQALQSNTTGSKNTAIGYQTLFHNTDGQANTATGFLSMISNSTGDFNVGVGWRALVANTIGEHNTAVGSNALARNVSGERNIGLGSSAGMNLTIGDDNIDIGNPGVAGEEKTTRIGTSGVQQRAFVAGINGVTVAGPGVVVNASGQLGVLPSSNRFKDSIKPMDKVSEAILALKPVTFQYKKDIDPDGTQQFGLVAEEVATVNPALVIRDADGKPLTVRYDAVNAMLLNEFLKEHRKVEKLEASLAQQQRDFETAVAELKGQIQKVSAHLELNKSAPQTVLNNR